MDLILQVAAKALIINDDQQILNTFMGPDDQVIEAYLQRIAQ